MTSRGAHALFWLLLASGAAADLLSKSLVFHFLLSRPDRLYLFWPGLLTFTAQENTGGPFSLFTGHSPALVLVTVAALLILLYLYISSVRRSQHAMLVALALVAAGALGNLLDRLRFGAVRDFINADFLHWGSWHYPVFNIADILITSGAFLMIILLLFQRDPAPQPSSPARS